MMIGKKRAKKIIACRSCGDKGLTPILSLGDQCLSDFTNRKKKPAKYPLDLVLCPSCNLLQLRHTVDKKFLYTKRYGYKSAINQTVCNNLQEIAKEAQAIMKRPNVVAIDIGANDGTLLGFYPKDFFKVAIEPIGKFAKESAKKAHVVINDFFNYSSVDKKLQGKKADIVTAISCFYDMEQPNTLLADVKKILRKDGILVIQQNYLPGMLSYNAFDNIVHEHLEYYSLLSLENLLRKHNLEVFDVKLTPINGGSFRTFIGNKDKKKIKKRVYKLRAYEKKLQLHRSDVYHKFADRVKKNRDNLQKFIEKIVTENKKVYAYGASTRGNTLLQYCGLGTNFIHAAVERNHEKWGKKIASLGIPIISEEQARAEKPDYMLVLPWFFKKEFLEREKKYLLDGGHFIFPLPKLTII